MFRRTVLASALAVLTCAPRTVRAQDLPKIRIATLTNDTASAILLAVKEGLLRKAGLDVELTGMSSGATISSAVAGGAAQFGQSSLVTLIDAHTRGVPFTLVAPSGLITHDVVYAAAIVRKDSPIKTARDLNGKTFAVPALLDLNQIAAMAWMDQNGGDSKTVKFIELSSPATIAAIEDGRVDAGQVGTPLLTTALDSGKTRILAQIFDAFGTRFENVAWFTTSDYAKANPTIVRRFAEVMQQASVLANTHRTETLALIADYAKLDPNSLGRMTRVQFNEYLDPREIQPLINAAAKYKTIDAPFPASDMISPLALRPTPK